ncbi:MAG: hypothetical protein QNJ70_15610 [Xenococcaceae cyanobacterium MO_207.B15]|nr:hypothetical protein [Xenococcaceae cyanobacterium MO_207.B15]MDJ0741900.1 hypothetical protein [Xenococcaceae cyanobacterium MO_167.B27]
MKTQWQQLFLKILFWLALEAVFNLIGIDDLADYSEFLTASRTIAFCPIGNYQLVIKN